jgi:hypothetical protein
LSKHLWDLVKSLTGPGEMCKTTTVLSYFVRLQCY